MDELLELILEIEKRPGLYIGNTDLKSPDYFLYRYIFAKSENKDDFGK